MKKKALHIAILTVVYYLCWLTPLPAQVKPASPSLQAGWSTNCIRALLLDEGTGTALTDMSGTAVVSLNTTDLWASDSEGPYVNTALVVGTNYISLNVGLPGAGIQAFSWYMRIKMKFESGSVNGVANAFTGAGDSNFNWGNTVENFGWSVRNASDVCASCFSGTTMVSGSKYNVIGTYAGDSIKVYVNGVRKCATALTGNMDNDGYTTRMGHGIGDSDCDAAGSVDCEAVDYYTVCVWQRVITPTEIAQIELAPYVMFGEELPGAGTQRRWIVQSMFPDQLVYSITALSILGLLAGIYAMIEKEFNIKKANDRRSAK